MSDSWERSNESASLDQIERELIGPHSHHLQALASPDQNKSRTPPEYLALTASLPEDQPLATSDSDQIQHLGLLAMSLLTLGLCLSVYLISVDRTIITTVGHTIFSIADSPEVFMLGHSEDHE